jgi:D-sedoheptulose 7-phosphate isomerase
VLKGLAETAPVDDIAAYFEEMGRLCCTAKVSDNEGQPMTQKAGSEWVAEQAMRAQAEGNKVIFIGNGGSAAICSHQAIEFLKNGGIRALALNDGASLTALANDFGYANVFAEQIKMIGLSGDLLIAISSSGQSTNILKAVEVARWHGIKVATFSGFKADNLLRAKGDVNFYVASDQYGFVEIAHHALIQSILDLNVIPRRSVD